MIMLGNQSPKEGAEREVGSAVVLLACDTVLRGGSKGPGRLCFPLQPSGMTQGSIDQPGPVAVAVALVDGLAVALMELRGTAAADAASRESAAVLIFILTGCKLDLLTIWQGNSSVSESCREYAVSERNRDRERSSTCLLSEQADRQRTYTCRDGYIVCELQQKLYTGSPLASCSFLARCDSKQHGGSQSAACCLLCLG